MQVGFECAGKWWPGSVRFAVSTLEDQRQELVQRLNLMQMFSLKPL